MILAVRNVMHLVDARTHPDLLGQLSVLAGTDERILSLGPLNFQLPAGLKVQHVHRPLNSSSLAAHRLVGRVGPYGIVHAWSASSASAGLVLARSWRAGLAVSLQQELSRKDRDRIISLAGWRPLIFITRTASARDELLKWIPNLPGESVEIIAPASTAGPADPQCRDKGRRLLGLTDKDRVLIAPGPLLRNSGHKAAIWTMGILRTILSDVHLVIPDAGPMVEMIRRYAHITGHPRQVLVLNGKINPPELLPAADVALFLGQSPAPAGALAEALAAGLAVVATDLRENAQLLGPDQAGVLIKPYPRQAAQAVLNLLENNELRSKFSANSIRWARQAFDPISAKRRQREIYLKILSQLPT